MLGTPGLLQCGKWWAGGDDPRSPLLSPIFGNLAGLPPIDLFMGASEIFVPDVRKLKEKIAATGGIVNLYEYPKAFHVFVGVTISPESKNVFDHIVSNLGVYKHTNV
jgi:acetyl esterase/lipase